jgi:hypothetical protein
MPSKVLWISLKYLRGFTVFIALDGVTCIGNVEVLVQVRLSLYNEPRE